ncbi:MAG: GerMN domain-containing protein [Clostridia bacterium]|nr:GerMN domain-containing protein [Clostridia bacterium]
MKKIGRTDMERILILCAAALVVVLALRGGSTKTTEILYEPEVDITQTAAEVTPAVETQPTVVYYQDGEGYLVPVTRQIPKTEGVAKATLSLMVKDSQNDMEAARLGLRTVIPEGTTFDLNIAGGKARVDMSKEALNCANAEEEALMVQAVASTLTCFDTVEEVSFLFDGQARSKLTHGTDVSGAFNGDYVNMESVTTAAGAYVDQVQLYFPSQTGRVLVPVTRTVFSNGDLTTALLELAKGPKDDSGLERPLPQDCGVKSVTVKDGTATINFSKGFMDVTSQSDGGKQAVRAILFTASQFPGVNKVEIQVEGEKFTPPQESTATFINEATEVMAQYPGVVEID